MKPAQRRQIAGELSRLSMATPGKSQPKQRRMAALSSASIRRAKIALIRLLLEKLERLGVLETAAPGSPCVFVRVPASQQKAQATE
jgi:hypothetical protein